MRSMVEGALSESDYGVRYRVSIAHHICARNTHDALPLCFDIILAIAVVILCVFAIVNCAINFDHETGRRREKIDNVGSDRMLPTKFNAMGSTAQTLPQ